MNEEYEKRYHELEEKHWWMRARRSVCRELIAQASRDRHAHILEIGCSAGLLMRQLREDGYTNLAGIDISSVAVGLCKARGIDNVNVMDAQTLAFTDNQFDILIASDVLEHLEDESKALQEWRRVLRPGGTVFVFVPAFQLLWSDHDKANHHFRRYDRRGLIQKLRANGFDILRSAYWNFFLFLPVLLVRVAKRLGANRKVTTGRSDLHQVSAPIDYSLSLLLGFENWCIGRGVNWPVGVSVMAVGRKQN